MCIDDGTANGQPHAHTVFFRRKESFEDSLWILQASAGIPHLDQDRFRAGLFGTNEEFFGTVHNRVHGLYPVEKQVENQLLQLHAIARHGRQILAQVRLHGYALSGRLASQEVEHLADHLIQIELDRTPYGYRTTRV